MYAKTYLLDPKEKNLGVKEKLSLRKFGAKSSLSDQELFQKARAAPRLQDLDTFLLPCASTVGFLVVPESSLFLSSSTCSAI